MFNFDEKKVYVDHLNGVNMIPQVEKVVDKICEDGYKNIFLVGIGGTLLYQQYANGNMKRVFKKMCKAKENVISDLEDMM